MQKLVVLRGAPGSGKSTIARSLRSLKRKIVWLKVDNFKDFFSETGADAVKYVNESALVTLEYLLDKGFSIVMEGIFQDPKYIIQARQVAKKKNIPFKVFEIECSLVTLQTRDKNRPGVKEGCRKPLGDKAIGRLYEIVKANPYKKATILNTERLSLNESIEVVGQEFNN